MNLPSSVFTSIPVSQHDIDADIKTERRRLAPLRDAAIHEADLASFQMVGVWAGMVSSIAWVFGNSSEPFLLTPTGELEASCAGFSCPLREWLQTDSATGYFTVTPRHSAASDTDAREPAWEHGGGGLGGFDTQGSSRLSFNQAPLTPSAPFDLWIGHIDHPATISNAYLALSTPLDAGENNRKERLQTLPGSWVLDIDLDAFMPPRFSHRVRNRHALHSMLQPSRGLQSRGRTASLSRSLTLASVLARARRGPMAASWTAALGTCTVHYATGGLHLWGTVHSGSTWTECFTAVLKRRGQPCSLRTEIMN